MTKPEYRTLVQEIADQACQFAEFEFATWEEFVTSRVAEACTLHGDETLEALSVSQTGDGYESLSIDVWRTMSTVRPATGGGI